MEENITLSFGVMRGTLKEQLKKQGYVCDDIETYEEINKSIKTLKIYSYIPENVSRKAQQKLFNNIIKNIRKDN